MEAAPDTLMDSVVPRAGQASQVDAVAGQASQVDADAVAGPIENVENDDLEPRDMLSFISAAVDADGLVGHNISSYNELVEGGIDRIMTRLFDIDRMLRNERQLTADDQRRKSFQVRIQFHDVTVGHPSFTTYFTGQRADLLPGRSLLTGLPYSGAVTMGATVTVRAIYDDGRVEEKVAEIPPFQIGGFPTMVGSSRCHTSNVTREGLKAMGEDPTDPGGYFIAKRGEYVVDLLENIRYNSVHVHARMKPNEHARAEFLSQPGGAFENSSQIRVRLMTSGQITVEINSTKFEKVRLPFYLLYRVFGMTDDRAVAETVVFDLADERPAAARMRDIVTRAFHLADPAFAPLATVINREELVRGVAERLVPYLTNKQAYLNDESAVQFLNEDLLGNATKPSGLDRVLLPHMGQTSEARIRKLRFLGLVIHKMLLVHLGVLPPTDRDSYRNKRVHGAGVSLAKAYKTQVNNGIVSPIFRAVKRELKNNPWTSIGPATLADAVRGATMTSDLNRAMEQAITSGNRVVVVKHRAATNRVSSQALERKNVLNTFSALRTVVTQNAGNAAKQTERADMMRRVHPTYTGFICVAQSPDTGENVGMRKQLAITAGVCTAGEALLLKQALLADPDVTPLDRASSVAMARGDLARVFVNGEWIGVCAGATALVARYRALRRAGRVVDPFATIYWDPVTDEVEFWLDVGRLRRPLLVVDNNLAAYDDALRARHAWAAARGPPFADAAGRRVRVPDDDPAWAGAPPRVAFVQNVRFTRDHARAITAGALTLRDLVAAGVAEYITPEEQENCLVAESVAALRAARGDVTTQYTHCDVEQAIFGLAAHMAPFGNHTQPARVTYETNQARQTGGWYALNFPYRTDKNRFFQFYNEVPLVRTFTNKLVPPNGANITIAYASYGGDNQEDSAIICQASADRGLFEGAFFRYELAELEKGESFGRPDPLTTKNLKPNACYEKLVDGFIRVGAVARFGDVLVGRVAKLSRGRGPGGAAAGAPAAPGEPAYLYTDRSVVYRSQEPAVVEAVLLPRGANDELFAVVKLRLERPLRVGDKLSSRSGNKSIAACMMPQSDMPFTEDGLTPDAIINTHCIPSRMTIGQLMETSLGKVCARKGVVADGTAFLPVDHLAVSDELCRLGFRFNGRERMYNGMTGEYFDAAIFIGPTAEQRLQKFVLDDKQSVAGSVPTDATTGQPLAGKHVQGGLRIGEMETWGLFSHGSLLNLYEKSHSDADGRTVHVCRGCGALAAFNPAHGVYSCRGCGELADIAAVESTKSAVLFHEELAASNVRMTLGLRPREFEDDSHLAYADDAGAGDAARRAVSDNSSAGDADAARGYTST